MQDHDALDKRWLLPIPNYILIKCSILKEAHVVLYASHLGYQKMLKKIHQIFYKPHLTIEGRDYLSGCEVRQKERVSAGSYKPTRTNHVVRTQMG